MANQLLVSTLSTVRVLFLALYTGLYIWLAAAYLTGTKLLPPPQRLTLSREVVASVVKFSWFFILLALIGDVGAVMASGGLGSMSLASSKGLMTALELAYMILLVLVTGIMQLVYLRRMRRIEVKKVESESRGLTWFVVGDVREVEASLRGLMGMSIIISLLGAAALALGIFSTVPI